MGPDVPLGRRVHRSRRGPVRNHRQPPHPGGPAAVAALPRPARGVRRRAAPGPRGRARTRAGRADLRRRLHRLPHPGAPAAGPPRLHRHPLRPARTARRGQRVGPARPPQVPAHRRGHPRSRRGRTRDRLARAAPPGPHGGPRRRPPAGAAGQPRPAARTDRDTARGLLLPVRAPRRAGRRRHPGRRLRLRLRHRPRAPRGPPRPAPYARQPGRRGRPAARQAAAPPGAGAAAGVRT